MLPGMKNTVVFGIFVLILTLSTKLAFANPLTDCYSADASQADAVAHFQSTAKIKIEATEVNLNGKLNGLHENFFTKLLSLIGLQPSYKIYAQAYYNQVGADYAETNGLLRTKVRPFESDRTKIYDERENLNEGVTLLDLDLDTFLQTLALYSGRMRAGVEESNFKLATSLHYGSKVVSTNVSSVISAKEVCGLIQDVVASKAYTTEVSKIILVQNTPMLGTSTKIALNIHGF